jgi:hypothetical protein
MNLLSELKRRNVIRVAGPYLVGAWLIAQLSNTVLPTFGAPDWVPRTIVILLLIGLLLIALLLIGLVPMLIFSWIYAPAPEAPSAMRTWRRITRSAGAPGRASTLRSLR